jgi:ribosome biogenesis protein MAK21
MKSIVLHEMENLLFKPNTSVHAQYYTIITMNQTVFASRDAAIANRLIEVYFMLFVKLLRGGASGEDDAKTGPKKKKRKVKGAPKRRRGAVNWDQLNQQEEEVNSKTLSAVLTGVNRAFPFSKVESDVYPS